MGARVTRVDRHRVLCHRVARTAVHCDGRLWSLVDAGGRPGRFRPMRVQALGCFGGLVVGFVGCEPMLICGQRLRANFESGLGHSL
jgi:hypothetical protein